MAGKRLIITYGDAILYDDVPERFTWRENDDGGIKVEAGPRGPNPFAGIQQQVAELAAKQNNGK